MSVFEIYERLLKCSSVLGFGLAGARGLGPRGAVPPMNGRAAARVKAPAEAASSAPAAGPAPAAPSAGTRSVAEHDHERRIAGIRAGELAAEELRQLSDVFGALAEPTRLRILHALAGGEACVYDLARALEMTSSAISHQLRVLRSLRLVRNRREGREVYYTVDDRHVVQVMSELLTHLRHGG